MKKVVVILTGFLGLIVLTYITLYFVSGYYLSESKETYVDLNKDDMDDFSKHKKYIDVNGTKVAYIDEGEGIPVVLIHGCPFQSYEWKKTIPPLRRKYRVIAPDLLGLGDTQVNLDQDYRLPATLDMVLAFLDKLNIKQAHFVGHDHGGAILQLMMTKAPERILTATLVNIEAYDQWPSKPELKYLRATQTALLNPFFWLALNIQPIAQKVYSIAVFHNDILTDEDIHAFTRIHISSPERWKRLQRFFRWQLDPEHNKVTIGAVGGMRKFTKPTLILWGKQDTNFGPELAERLANDIKGTVGIKYLEESSHLPMMEEAEKFNTYLLEFLALH